ncbi:MAG TPA: hypothetical protein VLB85_09675 [Acidimicrobiia bacterium]|nr:hypothetical protein [Acidimicrobiia bacterium]
MRPRQAAALAMTALLALAVVGASRSGGRGDAVDAPGWRTTVTPPPSPTDQTTVRSTMVDTTVVVTTVAPGEHDPVAVIRQGLAAWGRFAASRDLDDVEPWFAVEGPQYLQFIEEAATAPAVGGPAYSVTFDPLEVDAADPDRIRGRVVFVRTGEASQGFDWWIVLRRLDSRLQIWTVEEGGS